MRDALFYDFLCLQGINTEQADQVEVNQPDYAHWLFRFHENHLLSLIGCLVAYAKISTETRTQTKHKL